MSESTVPGAAPEATVTLGNDDSRECRAATWLASAGIDGSISMWNPYENLTSAVSLYHATSVWTLAVIPGPMGRNLLGSADVEGEIKVWDPLTGHERRMTSNQGNAINALAAVPSGTGETLLASADVEGGITIWDPVTAKEHRVLRGHSDAVYALAVIPAEDGTAMWLASADVMGRIKLWDPLTGDEQHDLVDRRAMIWDLAVIPGRGTAGLLASAGVDGEIHLWDIATWTKTKSAMAHPGVIYTLATLPHGDGAGWLASAGVDGKIRLWDVETGSLAATLPGHQGEVRDLTVIPSPSGGVWLVSAGGDGMVRLWDATRREPAGRLEDHWGSVLALAPMTLNAAPNVVDLPESSANIRQRIIRTKIAEIKTAGFGDRIASADLLDRGHLVDVAADLLSYSAGLDATSDGGPSVVSIEGPWGSGKTTMMSLIRSRVDAISGRITEQCDRRDDALRRRRLWSAVSLETRFTVRAADWALRHQDPVSLPPPYPAERRHSSKRIVITAWFNPWAHQSHEQVWAGLAREIISAARTVLYPDADRAERYWFQQNVRRLDRRDLKRLIWHRICSPLLRLSVFALLIPIVAVAAADQFTHKPASVDLFGRLISAGEVALLIPVGVLFIGLIHTLIRYLFGRASAFLPGEIFRGPLISSAPASSTQISWTTADDPMYNAPSGYLYLVQHDIRDLLKDIGESGYELIIFVDDLDRCTPKITADVFEAMNLFISESLPRVRFVVGLDPVIVAAHVDWRYENLVGSVALPHPGDPSPGWTFLRKLIQLPIIIPRIRERGLTRLLDDKLGRTAEFYPPAEAATGDLPVAVGGASSRGEIVPESTSSVAEVPYLTNLPEQTPSSMRAEPRQRISAGSELLQRSEISTTELAIERHPIVRAQIRSRLDAQLDRSARQAKRLLTVWQFYVRVCQRTRPLDEDSAIPRACALVLVAEILTRWPAWLRQLTGTIHGISGVQLLATHTGNDSAWQQALTAVGLEASNGLAIRGLRELLGSVHGHSAADLFTMVT
jgi:WD40 repeat protein